MVWWQWVLIFIAVIVIALLASYFIARTLKKPWVFSKRIKPESPLNISQQQIMPEPDQPEKQVEGKIEPPPAHEEIKVAAPPVASAPETTPVTGTVTQQSEILKEIEVNLSIASAPRLDKMMPFQTSAWDTKKSELEFAGSDIRLKLAEVYIDISLANRIVWMASEFGLKSKDLEEGYLKLCKNIADRLQSILPALQ